MLRICKRRSSCRNIKLSAPLQASRLSNNLLTVCIGTSLSALRHTACTVPARQVGKMNDNALIRYLFTGSLRNRTALERRLNREDHRTSTLPSPPCRPARRQKSKEVERATRRRMTHRKSSRVMKSAKFCVKCRLWTLHKRAGVLISNAQVGGENRVYTARFG